MKTNSSATTGLVLCLIATFFNFIPFLGFISIILGILAIIFGGIGWSKSSELNTGKGKSITAVILGIINIVFYFVSSALLLGAIVAS